MTGELSAKVAEPPSVKVSDTTVHAGRDVIISGTTGPGGLFRNGLTGHLRVLGSFAALSLLVFLISSLWPGPEAAPVDLDLETSYVRFRLAEEQPILGALSVQTLSALDLEEIRLPWSLDSASAVAGPPSGAPVGGAIVRREPGTRRLDLSLESLKADGGRGVLTLQQGFLPTGAVVEMKAGAGGSLRLSIDSLEQSISLSALGDYRFRLLRSGRKAPPWSEARAVTPQLLELEPRSGRLDLVVGMESQTGATFAPSIRIDRLWLYEVERDTDGSTSRLKESYDIRYGRVLVGSAADDLELGQGSELRIGGAGGSVSALRWSAGGLRFRFQGLATSLSRGPRNEAVDLLAGQRAGRSVIADVAAGLAVLNGLLSLVLGAPALLRLTHARLRSRRRSSAPNILGE